MLSTNHVETWQNREPTIIKVFISRFILRRSLWLFVDYIFLLTQIAINGGINVLKFLSSYTYFKIYQLY